MAMARRSACLLLAALLAVGAGAQRSHRATLEVRAATNVPVATHGCPSSACQAVCARLHPRTLPAAAGAPRGRSTRCREARRRGAEAGARAAQELEAKRLIPPGQHFYKKAAPLGAGAGAGGAAVASASGGLLQLGGGAHRDAGEHLPVPKGFLHVYDLPPRFNEDIKELPTQWHPEQYDIDQARPRARAQRTAPPAARLQGARQPHARQQQADASP